MADDLQITPATDANGFLPGPLGLRLDEEELSLTALHAPTGKLDAILPLGQWQQDGESMLLRLWPNTMWTSGDVQKGQFRSVDIAHGYIRFRLRGVEALHFVAQYTSTDIFAEKARQSRCLRTCLGGFNCVIMWSNTRDVHVLTDRSLAQSFVDHLRQLALRHDPIDPLTQPRPVSPGAPERRA